MRKIYIIIIGIFGISNMLVGQTMVMPSPTQSSATLLTGGTAHLGNGNIIENALVAFDKGKLTFVGSSGDGFDNTGYQSIDVSGKHIYPGFILPATDLGLTEVSSVRATIDNNETGQLNPNVRSIIAYNTDSELIPTMRFNGILTAQIRPVGGLISGTSSVVQLDAWNWEDALYKENDGIFMNWPSRETRQFDFTTFTVKTSPNKRYKGQISSISTLFEEAKAYDKSSKVNVNLKLAAMKHLFSGNQRLFINVNQAKDIIESVKFARNMGVKNIVVVGGSEAYLVKDFLLEENIPILLGNIHSLPRRSDDDFDMPYKMPFLLQQEGLLVGLSYRGTHNSRNLPFFAGTAAAYGLDKEKALQLITSNTAKILGIEDNLGSLEKGKDATLFVSEGDALDMRGNQLSHAFIGGRLIQLEATQQALYKKYKEKYQRE